jgi:hypothetical protein
VSRGENCRLPFGCQLFSCLALLQVFLNAMLHFLAVGVNLCFAKEVSNVDVVTLM